MKQTRQRRPSQAISPARPTSSGEAGQGSLRIIGGQWRRRRLMFPDEPGLRPTADRVRETLFNWLQPDVAGARCLDLFAGSGACGLEALSRGASSVVFVERNRRVVAAIRQNLELLAAEGASVINADVMQWLLSGQSGTGASAMAFDLVFLDPPYDADLLPGACRKLDNSGMLAAGAKIYLENRSVITDAMLPESWYITRQSRAGSVYYYLCQYGCDSQSRL